MSATKCPVPKFPHVAAAFEAIILLTGDSVALVVDQHYVSDATSAGRLCRWRAALRAPSEQVAGGSYPIFDPEDGAQELAAWGTEPHLAMQALDELLSIYAWEVPK